MKLAQSSRRLRLLVLTSLAIVALLLPTVAYAAPVDTRVESASNHGGSGCSTFHTVQRGDTLSEIAKWYGVSMRSLMAANNISNPNHIWIGQRICIPSGGGSWDDGGHHGGGSQGGSCSTWHTVTFGQTLSGIARWYGVSMWSLMQVNNISNPNRIFVGQRLCIPGGGWQEPPPPWQNPCNPCWPTQPPPPPPPPVNPCNPCWPTQPPPQPCNPCMPPPQQCNPCVQPPIYPPVQPTPVPPQPSGPWNAEFFNNNSMSGSPTWTTTYSQIGFNWGTSGPGGGVNGNQFSARFQRTEWLEAGTYRFYATSDDGVRVFVDNQLVIDGWKIQAPTTYSNDVALGTGNHAIRVEYFQSGGEALLFVNYTRIF